MTLRVHFVPIVLLAILSFAFGACAGGKPAAEQEQPAAATVSSVQQPPPESDDAQTVLDMVERLNSGDADGSLQYFAADAVTYFIGMPPTGFEIYRGRDALRPTWEDCANSHFRWEVDVVSSAGGVVTARTKTWHDFTRQLGVAPNEFLDVYVLKNGSIVEYASTLTEASLAKFKPALAEMMPPAALPTPSQEEAGSAMMFTTADGTCDYEGPMVLTEGDVKIGWDVKDTDKQKYALGIHSLEAGKDAVDLMAATVGSPPSWAPMPFFEEQGPASSGSYEMSAKSGPLYAICWSSAPDMPIGLIGPFEVVSLTEEPAPTPAALGSGIKFVIKNGGCTYEGPLAVRAGEVQVDLVVEDVKKDSYALTLFNLEPGKTMDDLMASTSQGSPPPWADMVFYQEQLPGSSASYTFTLEKGPLYAVCWTSPPDRAIRGIGPLEVEP